MKYTVDGVKFNAVVTVEEKKADVNFEVGKVESELSAGEFCEVVKMIQETLKMVSELGKH